MAEYIDKADALNVDFQIKCGLFESRIKTAQRAVQAYADATSAIPAQDVRRVVTCGECKWWTKQDASLQGRCELLQMYPTGAWFCANGRREES